MIVLGILIGLLIVAFLGLFVCFNKKLYCYVFEHKDWKLWNYFIKNYDQFKFEEHGILSDVYTFGDYYAHVWKHDGGVSVHKGVECILCSFIECKSKEFKKLLTGEE